MHRFREPDLNAAAQRTIVVAEDETTTRILLRRILERHGFRVIAVEKELEALKTDAATRSILAMMLSRHGDRRKGHRADRRRARLHHEAVDPRVLVARITQQL